MAELVTIARPYAEAAVQAGRRARATLAAWSAMLARSPAVAARRARARWRSATRSLTAAQVSGLFISIAGRRARPARRENFLRVLVDNGRLDAAAGDRGAVRGAEERARRRGRRRDPAARSRSTRRSSPTWWPRWRSASGRKVNAQRAASTRADRRRARRGRRRGDRRLGARRSWRALD